MSNRYNKILVSPAGGHPYSFKEGIIDGTPKPGTCMTIKAAVEPVNGRFTYEAFNRDADANRAEVIVLLEDELQGYGVSTAYVSGTRGRLYVPQNGDILQMLVANIAGTGDFFAIGDYLIIDDGTGKLIATTGSPEMESFRVLETTSAIAADTLILCQYTGA